MHTKVNESTFAGQPIYVGIDVHLKSWRVTVCLATFIAKHFQHRLITGPLERAGSRLFQSHPPEKDFPFAYQR